MHYKPENFNCRPNTLKKIAAGHYEVVGNSGKIYTIEHDDNDGWSFTITGDDSSWSFWTSMGGCLHGIKQLEPALNNKQIVTFKDSTKPQDRNERIPFVENLEASIKGLEAENAKKDKEIVQLKGVVDEQKSNIDDHERWLKRDSDVIVNLRKDLECARVDRDKHKEVALERLHAIDILEGLIIRMVKR
jgi:hypothetical protein